MCVIVFKPAGAAMPPLALLKHCWDKNPDGAGIAVSEAKAVFMRKGFMTWKEFEDFYTGQGFEKRTTQAVVMHFRIGTHGKKDAGNTHPFCVSPDPEKLRATLGRYPEVMAHNGIFQDEPKLPLISDTGQFIVNCCRESGGDLGKHWKDNSKTVGWSKMVVLRPGGCYRLFGSWQVTDYEGGIDCFFSNLSWKPYVSSGYTGYSGGYYDRDGYSEFSYSGCGSRRGRSLGTGGIITADEEKWIAEQLEEYGIVSEQSGGSVSWALGGKYTDRKKELTAGETKPSELPV